MEQEKQDCSERPLPEAASSALGLGGKHLDLQCPPPVFSFSVPRRRSIRLGLRLRGKRKQKGHFYDVGGLRRTRPGPCLFRRRSGDLCLRGRLGIWQRLFCAIDRSFCFCWHQCCFLVGLALRSEWASMEQDRRAGCAEFSVIPPKVGDEAPKRREGDTRGGEEP